MSLTVLPTKPAAGRPPTPPPVVTTFDGAPGDDGESALNWMSDNVRRAVRRADASQPEELDAMLIALRQRHKWVTQDLDSMRLFFDYPLPSVEGISIDYLLKRGDRAETTLLGLVNLLDEAIARSERRLSRHRFELRLLQDLDASNP